MYASGLHFSDGLLIIFTGELSHCHWNVVTVFVFNLKSLRGILFPQPSPSFPMAFSTGSLFLFAAEQRYRIPNFLFYIFMLFGNSVDVPGSSVQGVPPGVPGVVHSAFIKSSTSTLALVILLDTGPTVFHSDSANDFE